MRLRSGSDRGLLCPPLFLALLSLALLSLLQGCATARRGGAPDPSFDVDNDLKQLEEKYSQADAIKAYYQTPSAAKRDEFVVGRLTLMNIRYIQFVRSLTAERALLDSATQMLTLGLSLAGASVGAAGTKTLLAAIAAGVTGSREIIDKNYFYEKTVPALVAQMNAERKMVLVRILQGRGKSLDDYPFEQAVTDLHEYYQAGTFTGALIAIQAEAGAKERAQDRELIRIRPIAREHVVRKRALTDAIGALKPADLPKVQAALRALDKQPAESFEAALAQLSDAVFEAIDPAQITRATEAFKGAGIPVAE
jgi:hypothetical protein